MGAKPDYYSECLGLFLLPPSPGRVLLHHNTILRDIFEGKLVLADALYFVLCVYVFDQAIIYIE